MGVEAALLLGSLIVAAGLSVGGAAMGGAFGGGDKKEEASELPTLETGQMGEDTAKDLARKRMFREGTVFTSPSGLGGTGSSSTARIK